MQHGHQTHLQYRHDTAPDAARQKSRVSIYASNARRTNAEISTKEKIKSSDWNGKREQVNGRSIQAKTVNEHLDNIRFRIKEVYRQRVDQGAEVSAEIINKCYSVGVQQPKGHTVLELIDFHKKIKEPQLKKGSVKNYKTAAQYCVAADYCNTSSFVQVVLHIFQGEVHFLSESDSIKLFLHGTMQALADAITLGVAHLCFTVLDAFDL